MDEPSDSTSGERSTGGSSAESGSSLPESAETGSPDTGGSESLFSYEDPIFANKELLEINHLPEQGRIVGRDEEISELANALNPALFEQSPSNVLLYGKTGTGKSLCAKYVSRKLVAEAADTGVNGRGYGPATRPPSGSRSPSPPSRSSSSTPSRISFSGRTSPAGASTSAR
jgi:hypothetical protein